MKKFFYLDKCIWSQYHKDEKFLFCILKMFDNLNESSNNLEKICFLVVDFILNFEIQDYFPKIALKLIIHLIVLSCFSDDLLSLLHENLTVNFLHYFNSTDFMVILLNEGIIINLKHCKTIKIIDYNIKNFYVFSFQDQNLILSFVQWLLPIVLICESCMEEFDAH